MKARAYLVSVLVLGAMILSGCSTVRIPVVVTHPAEVNMSSYEQIAITEISGNQGQVFSDGLKSALVGSEHFKVVDRQRINQIMSELNLSQSDLVSAENRVKLGKLLSASVLISGRVDGNYNETTSSEGRTCKKDNKEYNCTWYYRKGIYSTNGGIDIIDVQTGQILISKTLSAGREQSTSAVNSGAPAINRNALASAALQENINVVSRAVSPWKETVQVPFKKDSSIPALEVGINQAKMGDLQEALQTFIDAAESAEGNASIGPKSLATAYWDIGLANEYLGNYNEAIVALKKAFSIDPDNDYVIEKKNVEQLMSESARLLEQTRH